MAGCLVCGLAACGDADDGRPEVLVTSYPLESVAEQVGGGHVTVESLTPPGGDTQGLEPAPRDVTALGAADLVVHLSGGMQPAVDDAFARQAPEHLVDAAGLADHGPDPHFWLDPLRLADLGQQVADELADLDPDHAADYAAANAEPAPDRLRRVAEEVQTSGARTIFFEAAAGPSVAEVLAGDLGLTTDVLHPIERVAEGETYPELMAANLAALRRGLVCG